MWCVMVFYWGGPVQGASGLSTEEPRLCRHASSRGHEQGQAAGCCCCNCSCHAACACAARVLCHAY